MLSPPSLLVISKGVHDAYFDAYTRVINTTVPNTTDSSLRRHASFVPAHWDPPRAEGSEPDDKGYLRISTAQHAERMRKSLPRYAKLLQCLPSSTTVIWMTPYVSYKVMWLPRLMEATRQVMLELFRAGELGEHSLLIDAWLLTNATNAPYSPDGNHRASPFQTTLWSLIRQAWQWRRGEHEAVTMSRGQRETI